MSDDAEERIFSRFKFMLLIAVLINILCMVVLNSILVATILWYTCKGADNANNRNTITIGQPRGFHDNVYDVLRSNKDIKE